MSMMLRCAAVVLLIYLCVSPAFLCAAAGRDFYKILGVKKNASAKQIKAAYRSLSKQYHPDKHPDDAEAQAKFVDIAAAYETLTDKEKRRLYDSGGEDALKKGGGGGGGSNPFDLFNFFGGGGGGGARQSEDKRGSDITVELSVSLAELYVGSVREVLVRQHSLCPHCRGSGADSESAVKQCSECGGSGVKVHMQQIGPGFVQQVQRECHVCGGKGKTITKTCHVCRGAKLQRSRKYLDVVVEAGMVDGARIEFENAADEHPDHAAGHIVFVIQQQPHADWQRRGNDLHVQHTISLADSLLGFNHTIRHLDDHVVHISSSDITPHNHVVKLVREGMPQHTAPSIKGDLYVKFKVRLPDSLTAEQERAVIDIFAS